MEDNSFRWVISSELGSESTGYVLSSLPYQPIAYMGKNVILTPIKSKIKCKRPKNSLYLIPHNSSNQ